MKTTDGFHLKKKFCGEMLLSKTNTLNDRICIIKVKPWLKKNVDHS
jgi:hypothetical protein